MPLCPYCEKVLSSTAALGGHVRQMHMEETKEEKQKKRADEVCCPTCGYKPPFTSCLGQPGLTVCPKCGCMFDKHTGNVSSYNWTALRQIGKLPRLPI